MIPKTIHYCWFGRKPIPEIVRMYMMTWKTFLSDYEIKEWNEDNFDINVCDFVREAYENHKYAFVADYVRLHALYNEGGIYLDTDVEIIRNMDNLLNNECFLGLETKERVGTSVIGSVSGCPFISDLLEYYRQHHFIKSDGGFDMKPNTLIMSEYLKKNSSYNVVIYPIDCFSPICYETKKGSPTDKTYSIHHYESSWFPLYRRIETRFWNRLGLRDLQLLFRLMNKLCLVK